jgi:tetratricopeptide (TPR) repeat protein
MIMLVAAWPSTLRAQGIEDGTPKRQAEAKLLRGVSLLKARRYAEALARFKEAYELVPSPLILYDFGLAQLGLGEDSEALASFEGFLNAAPDAPEDKRRKAAQYRDDLRARLAVGGPPPVVPIPAEPEPAASKPNLSAPVGPSLQRALPVQAPAATRSPAEGHRRQMWALTTAAAGAVSLGAGLTLGILASNEGDNVTSDSQNGREFVPATEASGLRDQRFEVVLLSLGTAAVLAGLGIYAYFHHREAAHDGGAP